MTCIIGLGNPGSEYANTRHNLGFLVLDRLVEELGLTWKQEFGVRWAKTSTALLIEPQEFMNVSGQTVATFFAKKKIDLTPDQIIIVHDDLDFPLGEQHLQSNRSAAGHNGVQSIFDAFGTQAFSRLRLGIGNNREHGLPAEDYVLQRFSSTEQDTVSTTVTLAARTLQEKIQG